MSDDFDSDLVPGENARYVGGKLYKKTTAADDAERQSVRDQDSDALRRLRGEEAPEEPFRERESTHLRGDREAHAEYEGRQNEDRDDREWSAEADRHHAEKEAEHDIVRTRAWSADDKAVVNHLGQRTQQFKSDMQAYGTALAAARANPGALTLDMQQRLQAAQQRLQAEHADLNQAAQIVRQTAAEKARMAEQKKLHREFPDLAKPEVRNQLVKWAQSKGVTKEAALNVTDPSVIGRAFAEMKAEMKAHHEAWLDRPREAVRQSGMFSPAGRTPSKISVSEARSRLAKSGSMDEAMNYLTLARERAKESRNG